MQAHSLVQSVAGNDGHRHGAPWQDSNDLNLQLKLISPFARDLLKASKPTLMAYLLQANRFCNSCIGHQNSNHDKISGRHWPLDVAVMRGSMENHILSL